MNDEPIYVEIECPACNGGGLVDRHTECDRCEGSGEIEVQR